jgi:hypothetical protein
MADPFISRDDLADHLHLPTGQLDDNEAALQAVDAACDWVRDLTHQTLNHVEDDVVLLDGTGTDALLLPETPVEEVSLVVVAGDEDATDWSFALHDSGVLMRMWAPEGSVAPTAAVWPKGRNNVEVTYTHGYADADFPRSIRKLALKIAARFYENPSGAVFESLGQRSVRYQADPLDLSTTEKLIIRKHRRKRQPSRAAA